MPIDPHAPAPADGQHQGLRSSEEEFVQIVAGVRDYAIFLLDPAGQVLSWNAGAERIKGYRPEEIIGQHFSRFYPADAVSSNWPAHELHVATQTGRFEDEGWRVRKDGTRFWANVVITTLRRPDSQVRGFLKITRDLTDRKQAEEKLRLSEERFRLLVEGVGDYAIFMLDPCGHVLTWNAGAERLKGYSANEILGHHFSRFYPEDARQRGWPEEELRRALEQGRFEEEGWRVRKDGTRFWANVVITALRNPDGTLHGFAKITRDLTERRQSAERDRRLAEEEAARQAAERLTDAVEQQRRALEVTLASIGDGVIVTDAHGHVTFLNPVAERLTGWTQVEATGRPLDSVFRIINEKTRQPVENPVTKVFRDRDVVLLANHTVVVRKDGREVPIEDSAAPIRMKEDEITGAVLVFRDVTEARRSQEARERLAAIVESSDDAIIGESLDGRITSWNKAAERLYGYLPGEVIGKPLTILLPPGHSDEFPTILERIKRGELVDHLETRRQRKDGAILDVLISISPIRDEEGEVVGASKIARDITARKEDERHKDEFLALLAHELRNPLAPLRNGIELLKYTGHGSNEAMEVRSMMERQLQHMIRLIDDLLDVNRINRGKLQLHKERLTVADLIDHTLSVCGPSVRDRGHSLTVNVPAETLYFDVDKTRITQALCNLLSNAAKYSDPGSPIWIYVEKHGSQIAIHVKDAGIGIPTEMRGKIFELFTQIDRSLEKSQGGLGVGLYVVKRLVELHRGSVEVHSDGPGTGSEFVIRLPLATAGVHNTRVNSSGHAKRQSNARILVVDDNVDAAQSLGMLLKTMGSEIRLAHDGASAVEQAEAFRPDMVLMDIGMPQLNGYEACRRIRQHPWGQRLYIVALTGWGQEKDKQTALEAGFDAHLMKPADPDDIWQLLDNVKLTDR